MTTTAERRRARPVTPAVADVLRAQRAHYDASWLDTDPLRWPRQFRSAHDRETVAVIAAALAYGRVASIHAAVAAVLARLGARPAEALAPSRRDRLASRLAGLRHRFTTGEDLAWLLRSVARARDEAGSLGAYVAAHALGDEPLRAGLLAWRHLAGHDEPDAPPVRVRARHFLLPDPKGGSANKRSLLLARWCVRPDDGLDLGLWEHRALRPSHLLVPLDTHVARTAHDLHLTRRRAADWATSVEVTRALATIDPEDPVSFDFALARPGIAGLCHHRHVPAVCGACPLAAACRHGRYQRTPNLGLSANHLRASSLDSKV